MAAPALTNPRTALVRVSAGPVSSTTHDVRETEADRGRVAVLSWLEANFAAAPAGGGQDAGTAISGGFTVVPPCTVAPTVHLRTKMLCEQRIKSGVQLSYLSIKNELSQQFGPETIDQLKRIVSNCVRNLALKQAELGDRAKGPAGTDDSDGADGAAGGVAGAGGAAGGNPIADEDLLTPPLETATALDESNDKVLTHVKVLLDDASNTGRGITYLRIKATLTAQFGQEEFGARKADIQQAIMDYHEMVTNTTVRNTSVYLPGASVPRCLGARSLATISSHCHCHPRALRTNRR